MPIADKIAALLDALSREDIDTMPPAARQRFAQLCQHWADFAKLPPETPKRRVLVNLRRGLRCE